MNHSRAMRSGYTRFAGVAGVGLYVNNEWLLVKVGRWIEYVCGVKSGTINHDRRVDLMCTWTLFLSEEILSFILLVSLEYASCVSGYNTSTRYRFESLSIPGWFKIYCTGSVSGESRSWEWFSSAIDCKLFNIDDSVNISNSFVTLVSGAPGIDKQQGIGIKLGSSGTPEDTDLIWRFPNHNSTDNIWWRRALTAARQIITQRNIR